MGEFVSLRARDGREFQAYLALPLAADSNGRGLVILPEVYNVNAWLRSVARGYAERGYTVLAPDLFWRQEPGVHLGYDQPERARAQGGAVDVDGVVSDVGMAAARMREWLGPRAPIGVLGFCLGGRLALLAGVREQVQAVVSYYGVRLDGHIDELHRLTVPALLHFGEADPWAPPAVVRATQDALASRPDSKIFVYQDAGHGFARAGYEPFDAAADQLARQRTGALFDRVLAVQCCP